VELHNFTLNAISQAATFVGVCEGFLGIPVNWDLWVHLFRVELHTLAMSEPRTRRAARAGGLALAVQSTRREEYIPCTMTSNNSDWERGWFYLRNAEPGLPPYTGKVLREGAASWYHRVSPPLHQAWLDSLVAALKRLVDRGLTAGCVLANLHHRRIVPLMERRLRIVAWQNRRCCGTPSRGRTRLPGCGAPSTLGRGVAMTHPCGYSRCFPPASW
jgi:hypothetical protein